MGGGGVSGKDEPAIAEIDASEELEKLTTNEELQERIKELESALVEKPQVCRKPSSPQFVSSLHV